MMAHSSDWALTVLTPRLYLRPVDPDVDASQILRMLESPQVTEFLYGELIPSRQPISEIPSLSSIKAILGDRLSTNIVDFAIEIRESPVFPAGVPVPKYQRPSAWAAHPPPAGSTEAYINRSDQKIIGTVGVSGVDELGYVIDEPWWGMGLATEAVEATIAQWQKSVIAAQRSELKAAVNPANLASAKVIEKCGFKRSGVREVEHWDKPGKKFELWVYVYKRPDVTV